MISSPPMVGAVGAGGELDPKQLEQRSKCSLGGGSGRLLEAEGTGAVRRMRWKKRVGAAERAEGSGKERVSEQRGKGAGERS